jgi:hypothetical protein
VVFVVIPLYGGVPPNGGGVVFVAVVVQPLKK